MLIRGKSNKLRKIREASLLTGLAVVLMQLFSALPCIANRCSLPAETAIGGEGKVDQLGTLSVSGIKRSFHLHVPRSMNDGGKVPLVIVLHGGAENWKVIRKISGMDKQSDRSGFIVAYPNGTGRLKPFLFWNAFDCCGYPLKRGVNDVRFISELIDFLVQNYRVDQKRVYVVGYSNGAMLAYRLGCELPEKIAAIGVIGGSMSGKEKPPDKPLSVIIFHSLDDEHVPYQGGGGKWERWGYPVNRKSVEYASVFWRKVDNCSEPAAKISFCQVNKESYVGGVDGSEVEVISIGKGGHSWPGGKKVFPFTDKPCPDIDATAECWKFFSRHER